MPKYSLMNDDSNLQKCCHESIKPLYISSTVFNPMYIHFHKTVIYSVLGTARYASCYLTVKITM